MSSRIIPFFLLPFLLSLFFYDVLFSGKTLSESSLLPGTTPTGPYHFSGHRPELPFSFDIEGNAWVNEPNPYILRRALDEKKLPSWSPWEGLGMPLIGNLNTEVFNPVKAPLNFFPNPLLQDIFFLLRLLVIGLLTYLFLMEMRLSQAASLLGSSFFMLCGYSIWWINLHPLSTVMYLPGVFYFYERWRRRKEPISAFFASLFLCCAFAAGKAPEILMGLSLLFLYAIWNGLRENSLRGLAGEGMRVIIVTASGTLMASAVLLPFIELYLRSSPIARAIRTGAASHTIPLYTSVSLFQPLLLGWKNYFYGAWLHWEPSVLLPHASIVILILSLYAVLNLRILKNTLPFIVFSLFLFSMVYGILPAHLVSEIPVIGSIEFLKYNAMFYFSLAVISAVAFDDLLSGNGNRKKFYLSVFLVSSLVVIGFFTLYGRSPSGVRDYIIAVLILTLSGTALVAVSLRFSKDPHIFGGLVFVLLALELYLYMPKDHPDRFDPYQYQPYAAVIKGAGPNRIIGSGDCAPPLVSNAIGLFDIRAVSVLLPGDYYTFFENLVSFSVPGTNNPNPLFSATSPYIDLLGVKYIQSQEALENLRLEDEIKFHVASLRWVRLFDSMINHSVKGGATYGIFKLEGEKRFSLFFPMKFAFKTKINISDPVLFAGFALKDVSAGVSRRIKMRIGDNIAEFVIRGGEGWQDHWLDVSRYKGNDVTITIESEDEGEGRIVLGNFGLSPGKGEELSLYQRLSAMHRREFSALEYKGTYAGTRIYENKNVMGRAFILHDTEMVKDLSSVIEKLQQGFDFREAGLLTDINSETADRMNRPFPHGDGADVTRPKEMVVIRKYSPDVIALDVRSKGGLLVLSDLFYPGWHVRVNGKEAEVVRVFGVLRGVLIGDGRSDVEFYYRPASFYAGIIISGVTVLIWGLYMSFKRKRRDIADV